MLPPRGRSLPLWDDGKPEGGSQVWVMSSVAFSQECDQVHIDDVSSDDNGQDLR